MRKLPLLFLGFAFITMGLKAQITSPGWFRASKQPSPPQPRSSFKTSSPIRANGHFTPLFQTGVPSTPVAEVITPQIQALADGLQDNPEAIFNYVHDHIRFVLYFGSKKGAALTLLEKSGNDFDQSALLVALLRAANYTNVQYQFGWQAIPYDDPYGYDYDLHHWWQLTLNNTVWTNTVYYLADLTTTRGYPQYYYFDDGNTFEIQRTWVALTIGSTTYQLDPAFKVSEPIATLSGFSLTNAMGGSGTTISNALLTAAGGTNTGNYTQSLNEASLRAKLTAYTTNFLNYIQANSPNASVQDILGGWQITPAYDPWDFSMYTEFFTDDFGGQMPILTWANEPTNIMSTLKITFAGTNYQWFMPLLEGQRISMTFSNNGTVQLWQDDTPLAQHTTSGSSSTTNVILFVHHPSGSWDTTNNVFIDGTYNDQIATNSYQRTNATYALLYAFEPDWGWLQQRQNQLDTYLQQGLGNGSRQVVSESLNVMGLNWMLQTAQAERMLALQLGILPQYFHRMGRMAQETGKGYYVDVYMQLNEEFPSGGDDAPHIQISNTHFDLVSFFGSALEHGLIEELQNTNLVGASTVKMLQIANTNGQAIYLASSTNWTSGYNVKSRLANYDAATLGVILTNYINQGYYVLLPQNGSNHVSTTAGSWAGYGYEARQVVSGFATESQMIIAGDYHGGYSSDPDIPIDPIFIDTSGDTQPGYYITTPVSTPAPTGADPVDLADGTFQVENTDLSLGQAEPRGITLSRYYNGTRRFSNPAGMAGGWVHNYSINAATVAAPQAGLGGTTPAQAASMVAATAAAIATYNGGYPNPKNWLTTALIAKWSVDQLTKSGVSVNLGKDTLQFVRQPNGVFTPPANCTATLTQNASAYSLLQRHGNTFTFDSLGRLTNILDPYSQSLNLTYNASNWVSTIKDWKNRTFTFNYSGTPQRLTSVTDGARTVSYGYATTYNAQGDLTSFTDPEGMTSTYTYDTNHQITSTLDAQSHLVVTNIYDTQRHIRMQYTQGDTNKTWRIYWSGWETTEFDPANGEQDYFYDDQERLIAVLDPLDYETDTYYDGQNHITYTVSPLVEVSQFVYDGNNNLIETIDPLGFSNVFVFDSQNNLTTATDARGNSSHLGYNAQFSLLTSTNGAGNGYSMTYNANGTVATRVDPGGTTSYNYDSYGQLSGITYPGSLGSESFVNNAYGDPTSHTNPRGFVTTYGYNQRRQLTSAVGPTNLTISAGFDAVGNMQSSTDGRGNTTTYNWSPTRHQTGAVFPSTPQGVPATTNFYDVRDWLSQTRNPLQQPAYYANNAAQQLIAVADALSRTNTFLYDPDGHRTNSTDAASETTSSTSDPRGQTITVTDAAGGILGKAYDAAGNNIYLTNRNGKLWQFQYDSANRLTNTISPTGKTTGRVFNSRGLLQSVKDAAGNTSAFQYDAKGRMVTNADNAGTRVYVYDPNDNVVTNTENGQSLTCQYDAYDRLTSFTNAAGYVIKYNYDNNGNVTGLTYPGNLPVAYTFDSLNRVTSVTDWAGRMTTNTYDLAGKLTSITRPNGTTRTLAYDAAGQMTNIVERYTTGAMAIEYVALSYNNAARTQWEFVAPLPHPFTPPSRTMTYSNDNRLAKFNGTSVTIDNNGNMTYGPGTNNTFGSYTYDARNRLTSAGGLNYGYDPGNNRVSLTNGSLVQTFVIDPRTSQVLMRITPGVTNYYVYGNGLLYELDVTATTNTTLYYHYDSRGSTVALTDGSGNITDRMEYSAYGTVTYRAGTNDTPFLYNGRYGVQTDLSGLLYMRNRYYNPYICRFISQDPSGFGGGLNMFQFADGNPISETDPFGLGAWTSIFGGLRMIGGGLEAATGYTLGVASGTAAVVTSETVVGAVGFGALAVGGAAVGAHGVDSFQTGFRQMISGQPATSLTSGALQSAGMSQNAANLTDAGISIVGSFGAGAAGSAVTASQLAASSTVAEVANAPLLTQMGYYETGQLSLSQNAYSFYSVNWPNAVDRGAAMVADQGWLGAWSMGSTTMGASEGTLFTTGLPTALGSGVGGSFFSGLGYGGQSYLGSGSTGSSTGK